MIYCNLIFNSVDICDTVRDFLEEFSPIAQKALWRPFLKFIFIKRITDNFMAKIINECIKLSEIQLIDNWLSDFVEMDKYTKPWCYRERELEESIDIIIKKTKTIYEDLNIFCKQFKKKYNKDIILNINYNGEKIYELITPRSYLKINYIPSVEDIDILSFFEYKKKRKEHLFELIKGREILYDFLEYI